MNIFSSFSTDVRSSIVGWSERLDIAQKLLSLLNSYTPKEVRTACLGKSSLLCSRNFSCLTKLWRSARRDVDLVQFVLMPWLKVCCTVEPRFNEMPRDYGNWFVISRVRHTVEPRPNEPLYNKVLGITNDVLQCGLVKCMEQNLDITNARYNAPNSSVHWHFVNRGSVPYHLKGRTGEYRPFMIPKTSLY